MASTSNARSVDELELPMIDPGTPMARDHEVTTDQWLARGVFGYVVTRYEDCVAVLRDRRWHSAASKIAEMMGVTDEDFLAQRTESILSAEGETHTRLRRLVGQTFSPRSADRLRPFMREVMNDLVDEIVDAGRAEAVADLCEPYPIPIICELLGAPRSDWQLFSRWATDVLRIFNGTLVDDLPVIKQANLELNAYLGELIADRRKRPADDLLSDLIAIEESGDRLSTEELVMMAGAVLVGGTDTTRNQLGCALANFAGHPAQWDLLAERPELAPRAVEESMRYIGAVRGTGRFASEDIEYRGVRFPAGTFISPILALANRDDGLWAAADTFDISREPAGQPHLTFGAGIHYCLGASLARAELQEALVLLSNRLPGLALDGEVVWKPDDTGIWGPERLPIRFTGGR